MDFTCTAMRRPEVLRRTLESFRANLLGVSLAESRLFINIDPLPSETKRDDTLAVACEFFGEVRFNAPRRADFGAAFKWCAAKMSPSKAKPYGFHLEDDWELVKPVAVADLIALLDADPGLSCVYLRGYMWKGDDPRICLSPGLWRSRHMHKIADRLVPGQNPEKQLREKTDENPHGGAQGEFYGRPFPAGRSEIVIEDIGREWMESNGVKKNTADPLWNRWEVA